MLGSVAADLLQNAPCSVLAVRLASGWAATKDELR